MGEEFKKWFGQLTILSEDKVAVPSSRVRALIKDLLELKARGWIRNTTISRNPHGQSSMGGHKVVRKSPRFVGSLMLFSSFRSSPVSAVKAY